MSPNTSASKKKKKELEAREHFAGGNQNISGHLCIKKNKHSFGNDKNLKVPNFVEMEIQIKH